MKLRWGLLTLIFVCGTWFVCDVFAQYGATRDGGSLHCQHCDEYITLSESELRACERQGYVPCPHCGRCAAGSRPSSGSSSGSYNSSSGTTYDPYAAQQAAEAARQAELQRQREEAARLKRLEEARRKKLREEAAKARKQWDKNDAETMRQMEAMFVTPFKKTSYEGIKLGAYVPPVEKTTPVGRAKWTVDPDTVHLEEAPCASTYSKIKERLWDELKRKKFHLEGSAKRMVKSWGKCGAQIVDVYEIATDLNETTTKCYERVLSILEPIVNLLSDPAPPAARVRAVEKLIPETGQFVNKSYSDTVGEHTGEKGKVLKLALSEGAAQEHVNDALIDKMSGGNGEAAKAAKDYLDTARKVLEEEK